MRTSTMFRGVALAAMATVAGAGVANAELKASFKPSPEFTDGDFKFKVRGRAMIDVVNVNTEFDDATAATDLSFTRSAVRRARIGVEGQFDKKWKYKAEYEFGSGDRNSFRSVLVEYVGKDFSVILGQDKAVAPLEEKTSSRYLTFNERGMIHRTLDTGPYAVGVHVLGGGPQWSWGLAYTGDDMSNRDDQAAQQVEESQSALARLTWAPILQKSPEGTTVFHVGAYARHRDSGGGAQVLRYRYRQAGDGVTPDTADVNGVATATSSGSGDTDTTYGVETALVFGPFSLQGEYLLAEVDAKRVGPVPAGLSNDYDISGYYVDAIWNITGESREYRGATGEFSRITPRSPLAQGGIGLWQVAARYENVDASEVITATNGAGTDTTLGEADAYTVGVNWFPNAYVGFKLNYAVTEFDRGTIAQSGETQVVSFRTQFDW